MPDLTEQQKLERRRLKRQQRILQSAGDRLERITGTAFPDRISPCPSPSTSSSSLRPASVSSLSISTNNRTLRSVSSASSLHQQNTMNDNDEMTVAEHFPASNDPRRRTYDTYSKPVLEDIKSVSTIPPILLEPSTDDIVEPSGLRNRLSSTKSSTTPSPIPQFSPLKQRPLSLMNTLLMRKLYRQQHHHSLDPTLKYWNFLHFISMIWLTLCGLYTEWKHAGNLDCFARLLHDQNPPVTQFPLFRNFIMLELLLFGAFTLYHPQDQYPLPDDDFTLVASQLPSPLDYYITSVLSYRRNLFCLIQDLSIIVFIIGFAQVLSKIC
ncbi:hypothetical protein BC941DRAFT_418942 [Chlamydoabsidia padenii]|nr:hypothetical protein BC941DRAFT_418942 [Chlamydoabsidia padenii]